MFKNEFLACSDLIFAEKFGRKSDSNRYKIEEYIN